MCKPAMFRSLFSLTLLFSYMCSTAQTAVTLPREPSPAATVSQTIGISTVNVNYSRPSVKGREIWGKLVPYGWNVQPGYGALNSAPWRGGANENTILTLSHAATVQGQAVPAGSYGLFFVINADNTGEVILSKDYTSWGSFWYDAKQDQMRAKITVRDVPASTERLTYEFDDLQKNSGELQLVWEKKVFPVKIEFNVDQIVMENAAEQLKNTAGFSWVGYFSAANYALQNNINEKQAMTWVDRAITMDSNYADISVKAALLKKAGDSVGADKLKSTAINFGTENDLNNYGYNLVAAKKFDQAVEVFKLNTKKHPNSANAWDSLGEGYALAGDKKNAIASFKKSLSLNPPEQVKANSEKYMKQLGAM